MKKYPSVWITKIHSLNYDCLWDVSVKMRADMEATHITKDSKKSAIEYCNENYGGYDSIIEDF